MADEKERFTSRLSTIPGIRTMPSIGDWVLLSVPDPSDVARRVNRRFDVSPLSVPRHISGAVRVTIRDPKTNELVITTLREILAA